MPSRTSQRQVQPAAVVLEHVDDAQALLVVVEAAGHQRVDDALAGVAERRVPEIVAERDRFGQLLVQPQHLGDGPRDLRHLERVRQPRAVVIAGRREEHLRLVLQPPERLAVDDAIAIALKRGPDVVFRFGPQPAARVGALGRLRRQDLPLARFELFANESCARCISRRKLVPWASGPTPKMLGQRLAQVGERRRRARDRRRRRTRAPVDEQRHVLARVIGARRRRIVAVIGGDDRAGRPARAAAADPARRRSNRSRLRGVAGDVVAMAVLGVEVHQVREDQPVRRPRQLRRRRGPCRRRRSPCESPRPMPRPANRSSILPIATTGTAGRRQRDPAAFRRAAAARSRAGWRCA